jgi:branched-chain amino acid transport system permease protein
MIRFAPLRVLAALIGVAALLALPRFAVGSGTEFASDILVYATMAMGLYIQVGLLGLVNFGYSAFFGLGAYAGALYMVKVSTALLPSLLVSIAGVAIVAVVIGAIALRASGTAFVMITLTFSQLLYVVALADDRWTNGVNGITGVRRPRLPESLRNGLGMDLSTDAGFYYLCLVAFVAVAFGIWLLQRSRLGAVFAGIRENEERMVVLGYPVYAYKLAGFALSGAIGGLAGYLNALLFGFAGPGSLFWTTSGEALLMVILGGTASLAGPIVGAVVFTGLSHYATAFTDHWRLVVGVIFILLVLFAPEGLMSFVRRRLGLRTPSEDPMAAVPIARPGTSGNEPPRDSAPAVATTVPIGPSSQESPR